MFIQWTWIFMDFVALGAPSIRYLLSLNKKSPSESWLTAWCFTYIYFTGRHIKCVELNKKYTWNNEIYMYVCIIEKRGRWFVWSHVFSTNFDLAAVFKRILIKLNLQKINYLALYNRCFLLTSAQPVSYLLTSTENKGT